MKTVSFTEYVVLCLQYMKFKDVAIGLPMLVLLLFVIEILEISIKGLLLIGGIFALYKALAGLRDIFHLWWSNML